jgi:hypothetical protein
MAFQGYLKSLSFRSKGQMNLRKGGEEKSIFPQPIFQERNLYQTKGERSCEKLQPLQSQPRL